MVNDVIHSFLEYDEEEKDEAWAAEKCKVIIMNALPIMTKQEYEEGENILFGKFPEVNLNKIFSSKTMQPYKDKLQKSSLFIFESARNAMIDDRTQANFTCIVNSLDPAKEEKREQDKALLKNRKGIEFLMNEITQNNGMPPQRLGPSDYNGNVDEFDQRGGDDLDDDSIDTFFEAHWGLQQEVMLQKPINAIERTNRIGNNFDKYINDILICQHCWSRCYVDDRTGSIRNEHVFPWQINVLNATGSNDFKDAQGFRIPINGNVRSFLKEFGQYFDITKDWNLLLASSMGTTSNSQIQYNNANRYGITGFTESGTLICGSFGHTIDFKAVLDLPIEYEYAEWKTINRKRKQWVVNQNGNIIPETVDRNTKPVDGVSVETKAYEDTYRAWYFRTGAITPKLIKWGKLYMQNIEGLNDEYSGFSIKGNKRNGVPMVEILRPWWNIMNVSFKMFEMLVNDVKPDGWFFNYTSLMKIVQFLQTSKDAPTDTRSAIDDFLKMVQESPNALSDNPTTDEGDPLGGGNMAILPKKNGLNQAAVELMKIMDWVELKVQKYTSTEGITLSSRAGDATRYELLENKKRSRQATSFIDFILLAHLEDIAISNINFVLDISKFKDTQAYRYLEALTGERCMNFISSMEKAPHRYGTFIDTFNNDIELMEMKQLAMQEYQKGTLPFEDMLVVRSSESIKDALAYLAGARRKAQKQQQQQQMDLLKQQDANAEKEFQRQVKLENLKGQWLNKAKGQEALGFSNAAAVNAKSRIAAEQLKQEGQNERLAEKATNEIDQMTQEFALQQQQPAKI